MKEMLIITLLSVDNATLDFLGARKGPRRCPEGSWWYWSLNEGDLPEQGVLCSRLFVFGADCGALPLLSLSLGALRGSCRCTRTELGSMGELQKLSGGRYIERSSHISSVHIRIWKKREADRKKFLRQASCRSLWRSWRRGQRMTSGAQLSTGRSGLNQRAARHWVEALILKHTHTYQYINERVQIQTGTVSWAPKQLHSCIGNSSSTWNSFFEELKGYRRLLFTFRSTTCCVNNLTAVVAQCCCMGDILTIYFYLLAVSLPL